MDFLSALYALVTPPSVPTSAYEISDTAIVGLVSPALTATPEPPPPPPREWPSYELKTPPRSTWCSCVVAAKWATGREDEWWGNAWNIKPDTDDPYEARYLLTREGARGHMVVVASSDDTNWYIKDWNYAPCRQTTRTIAKDSPLIRGMKK